jgi:hypothetical protein
MQQEGKKRKDEANGRAKGISIARRRQPLQRV